MSVMYASTARCSVGSSAIGRRTRIHSACDDECSRVGPQVDRRRDVPELDRAILDQAARERMLERHAVLDRRAGPPASGMPSGIGTKCSRPSSWRWNEAIIEKIGSPVLVRLGAARRERPAVVDAVDGEEDLLVGVARAQEVAVHRVHGAVVVDRAARRDDALREHLTAEHPAVRHRLEPPTKASSPDGSTGRE